MSLQSMFLDVFKNKKVYYYFFELKRKMTHTHKSPLINWLMGDWNQVEWIERLWVGAWFGITIWTISTNTLTYALFAILLALRIVAPRHKNRSGLLNLTSGLFSPDLLVSIVLTIQAFLNLDRVTNFTAWQTLTGISLAGTIISGLTIVYKFLQMGLSESKKKEKPAMVSVYANIVWALAWFGVAIWILASYPLYATSALILVIRLGLRRQKTWADWLQACLVSAAILVYVVLVENHTDSPWTALVVLASIGLAIDALSGLRLSMDWFTISGGKVKFSAPVIFTGNEMKTPTGLKNKK